MDLLLSRTLLVFTFVLFTACSDESSTTSNPTTDKPVNPTTGKAELTLYPAEGAAFTPQIRRTTAGVPHINGSSLSEVSAGLGFAQAEDNLCVLADGFLKIRGERAEFLGAGPDDDYVLSDFSFLALQYRNRAEADLPNLSPSAKALLNGYVAGYNHYIETSESSSWPAACRDQAWVRKIDVADLMGYYRWVGQLSSTDYFGNGALLAAVPPGESTDPTEVGTSSDQSVLLKSLSSRLAQHDSSLLNNRGASPASNAWGIGSELTENGRGGLLANPHFPYTGSLRLYQSHLMIPNEMNAMGAGLLGLAVPQITFNENVAWTHTFSTANTFTVYRLELDPDNPLAYLKEGISKPITTRTIQIRVANGTDSPTVLERKVYDSEYGPMVSLAALTGGRLPAWSEGNFAYTYRDANANYNPSDTWVSLATAANLEEFQTVFKNCGSTLWTNSIYTDKEGNSFYIDSSGVPNLSEETLAEIDKQLNDDALYELLYFNGLVVLDGSKSRDDWVEGPCDGRVPYENMPKLQRNDFVQNSNDSYWSTNPAELLTGYSILYGEENEELDARTRLGLGMLQKPTAPGFGKTPPAGDDGKFNAQELLQVIWNNRALYSELYLTEVRERCALIGDTLVELPDGGSRSVVDACTVLASWSGNYDSDAVGAHLYRLLLVSLFTRDDRDDLDNATDFDPGDPVNTPSGLVSDNRGEPTDPVMQSLVFAMRTLEAVSIPLDATLGSVQTYTPSGGAVPGGTPIPLADALPWHGGSGGWDGAFNAIGVVNSTTREDTVLPRLSPPTLPGTGGLAQEPGLGWLIGRGTSYHIGLQFNDDGPEAWGLTSYGQSTDPASAWYTEQSSAYSTKTPRAFVFKETDIEASVLPNGETILTIDRN